jgi:MFS family permease
VFGLGLAAAVFQLLVWLVPNIIGDSIAVALVGYVLGPIAPCSMVMFLRLLPRSIQTLSVSFISSAGSSGGAIWPFLTGLIAQSKGTFVLHPICVGLFALMLGCWWMLPGVDKRRD